jgi:hypothetical protein
VPIMVEADLRFPGGKPTDGSDAESDSHPGDDDVVDPWRAPRYVTAISMNSLWVRTSSKRSGECSVEGGSGGSAVLIRWHPG